MADAGGGGVKRAAADGPGAWQHQAGQAKGGRLPLNRAAVLRTQPLRL
jgi:hypothetical protein